MRVFVLLLLIVFYAAPLLSQKPSAQQIQAQKNEALSDAKKERDDLKKQIAEAKAKKEDPESIRELEKQLSTIEQIVTMLEKTFSSPQKNPGSLKTSKTAEPKYVSPFVPIVLKQPVTPPTKDNAKDHLLWYTGKKIDAHTLITISGVIVRYDRQRNLVIVQTDQAVDTPYYGLVNTLAQTPQMKTQFAVGMIGITNSFLMWPEILKAYNEYNFFKDRYYDLAKNTFDLNDNSIDLTAPPDPNLDRNLIVMRDDLDRYLEILPTLQNIVMPPKRPNDLCKCDPEDRENYEAELDNWMDQFYFEETKILLLLKALYQHIAFRDQLGFQTTPLAHLKEIIVKAFNTIIERSKQKLWELSKQYQEPDIHVEEGLVMATLSLQKLLMHIYSDIDEQSTITLKRDAYSLIERIKDLIMGNKVFEKYMKDQMTALNYNSVLDYSLYLAHEYNKKLLSPSYDIKDNYFQTWMESLKKFNRFTLSMSFDFDYRLEAENSRALTVTGGLEAKNMVVGLGRSSCKWHFYLADVNHAGPNSNEDTFYIPVKVIKGTKIIYRDPQPPIVLGYTGPPDMEMVFPDFELTFCNTPGSDTIFMNKLRYSEKVAKAYMAAHPKIDFGSEFSLDMFQYANKMFVSAIKTKENANELISIVGNMMNIQTQTPMPNSTGNQNLDKLLMDYVMNQKRRSLQQSMTPVVNTAKTILPFDAVNGSKVLVSASFDTADPTDPDRNAGIKLIHGIIRIKIEHTPQ